MGPRGHSAKPPRHWRARFGWAKKMLWQRLRKQTPSPAILSKQFAPRTQRNSASQLSLATSIVMDWHWLRHRCAQRFHEIHFCIIGLFLKYTKTNRNELIIMLVSANLQSAGRELPIHFCIIGLQIKILMSKRMKSGFYYTNPERKKSIKPLNLIFKCNLTIKRPKIAITIMVFVPMIFL